MSVTRAVQLGKELFKVLLHSLAIIFVTTVLLALGSPVLSRDQHAADPQTARTVIGPVLALSFLALLILAIKRSGRAKRSAQTRPGQ